jgi:hypothetical protein
MTWFTLQKQGLLRPMQLLRAFVHWDHENRPAAPVFEGVNHSCQSRQYFAVTSGLESHDPFWREFGERGHLTRVHRITPLHQSQPVNFADSQKYNEGQLPWMN